MTVFHSSSFWARTVGEAVGGSAPPPAALEITALGESSDFVATLHSDGQIKVWSLQGSGTCLNSYPLPLEALDQTLLRQQLREQQQGGVLELPSHGHMLKFFPDPQGEGFALVSWIAIFYVQCCVLSSSPPLTRLLHCFRRSPFSPSSS